MRVTAGGISHFVVVMAEWPASKEHLVEHYTEAPQIGSMIDSFSACLLRAHVRHGSGNRALPRGCRSREDGDSEIEQLGRAIPRDENVRRLDVPMDDPFLMRGRQGTRDLFRQRERLLNRQPATPVSLLECLPVVVTHHDEEPPRCGLTNVVDDADIRVIEGRCCLGFTEETGLGVRVGSERPSQELQRDEPVETLIESLEHDAHASSGQLLEDPVLGERSTDEKFIAGVAGKRQQRGIDDLFTEPLEVPR
jgi:hypothetical protein